MKRILALLCGAALVLALSLSLVSCTTPEGEQVARQAANIALTGAVIGGYITPAQAALVRQHGALILDAKDGPAQVVAISNAALAGAEASGNLTPEQAAALREAGTVPLSPPAAVPVVDVTSSK
jgi:hypothetical protein